MVGLDILGPDRMNRESVMIKILPTNFLDISYVTCMLCRMNHQPLPYNGNRALAGVNGVSSNSIGLLRVTIATNVLVDLQCACSRIPASPANHLASEE